MNWKAYSPVKDPKELVGFVLLTAVSVGFVNSTKNSVGIGHAVGAGESLGNAVAKMLPAKK